MKQHTPGPWVVKEWQHLDTDGSVAACGSHVTAKRGKHDIVISASTIEDEDESDLHLIAAAPDLLEEPVITVGALKEICVVRQVPLPESAIRRAEAAIAKAKGGAA